MKVIMKIGSLDYADAALRAIPLVQKKLNGETAVSKLLLEITKLPPELLRPVIEGIPAEEMNQVLSMLVEENQERLRVLLQGFLKKVHVPARIDRLTLNRSGWVEMIVSDIQYEEIVRAYLPKVRRKLRADQSGGGKLLYKLSHMPEPLVGLTLKSMPEKTKADFVVQLINLHRKTLCQAMSDWCGEQGVRMEVEKLAARN